MNCMRTISLLVSLCVCCCVGQLFATGDTLSTTPDLSFYGLAADDFGSTAALADVNGDGLDDLVVGAPFTDHTYVNQGDVRVYFSEGDSFPTVPDQVLIGLTIYEDFGDIVREAGDVNNDGYEDIIVSGYGVNAPYGNLFLYLGSPTGLSTSYAWQNVVDVESYTVIVQIHSGFDVNLDGYQDVIIGDVYDNFIETNDGAAHLYLGGPGGLALTPSWSTFGDADYEYYGSALSVGDINDDGWPDIACAANGYLDGIGRVEFYLGGAGGYSVVPDFVKYELAEDEEFGDHVDIANDMNNDGVNDMVVSVGNRIDGEYSNAIELYYGPFTTGVGSPDTILVYAMFNSGVFGDVFRIADFQNDGYPDILARTDYLSDDYTEISIISFTEDGISEFPVWSSDFNFNFSFGFYPGDDYNGDSLPDILVNHHYTDFVGIITGKNNFPGLPAYAITYTTGYLTDQEYFGYAISSSGDLNNDGINDMITGSGVKGYAFLGDDPEMNANSCWTYNLFQTGSELGKTLRIVEDVNSDNFDDVLIAAPDFDYAAASDGFVGLFKGNSTGVLPLPLWVKTGAETDYQFGKAVSSGDMNGDSFTDLVIGSPGATGFISRTYLYFGNGAIPDESADLIFQRDGKPGFGYRLASGDVNGDGFTDLLITEDYTTFHPAKVWLYLGGTTMDTTADWSYAPLVATQDFGEWISMDADYNGDGLNDIVVGDPTYTNGQTTEGCLYVFYGKVTGPSAVPDFFYESNVALMKLGTTFAGGDVNGDGFDELSAGMPDYDAPTNNGLIKIFYGKAGGIVSGSYSDVLGATNANTGKTVAYSRDADGDAIGDLFVGHWSSTTTFHGYIDMHKGKLDLCSLYADTTAVVISDTTISVQWNDVAAINYNIRLRKAGTAEWTIITTTGTTAEFTELDSCTLYELQLNAECSESSGAWNSFFVTTIGCPLPCELVEIPSVIITGISGSTATVTWEEPEEALSYIVRYKQVSGTYWIEFELPVNSIVLGTLTACTNYEVQIKSDCGADTSYWSDSYLFTTTCGGCGTPPTGLYESPITATAAKLHWIADPGASKYKVYYRQTGAGAWIIVNAHQNFRTLTGLSPATSYQYKVKSLCAPGVESAFSAVKTFTTVPLRSDSEANVSVSVYPSPNDGNFSMAFEGFITAPTVRVFALNGQLVYEGVADNVHYTQVSLQSVGSGMYFIELNDGVRSIIEKCIISN